MSILFCSRLKHFTPTTPWSLPSTPSTAPFTLPVYAEALAAVYANASSDSISVPLRRRRRYDPDVLRFIDHSAYESDGHFSP